jgi:hypothetical protein
VFPASFWSRPLPRTPPEDEKSEAYIHNLLGQMEEVKGKPSRKPTLTVGDFGAAIWYVAPETPTQRIWLDARGANPELEEALKTVPIPFGFRATGPFKREEVVKGELVVVQENGDNEAMIFDPAHDVYYEFFGLLQSGVDLLRTPEEVPPTEPEMPVPETLNEPGYHCLHATVINEYSKSKGNAGEAPKGSIGNGISGSGMHQAGGPIRIEEVERGRITHPVKIQCLGNASGESHISPTFRWPASKSDGRSSEEHALQEGMIFWLPATSIEKPKTSFMRMVARAANEYGLILTDGSAAHVTMFLDCRKTLPRSQAYGTDRWLGEPGGTPILQKSQSELASEFPWADLKVVSEEYRPVEVEPGFLPGGVTVP